MLDRGLRPGRPAGWTTSDVAAARVAEAAGAAHELGIVLTGRAENHIRGVDDLDDTIARLVAYRDAGADCLYAPGLTDLEQIRRVVDEVGAPVNVLALPTGPPIGELEAVGVRRVSTGSLLAGVAYGALVAGAQELHDAGTSKYAAGTSPATCSRARSGSRRHTAHPSFATERGIAPTRRLISGATPAGSRIITAIRTAPKITSGAVLEMSCACTGRNSISARAEGDAPQRAEARRRRRRRRGRSRA